MSLLPPRATLTDTLVPYTTRFRPGAQPACQRRSRWFCPSSFAVVSGVAGRAGDVRAAVWLQPQGTAALRRVRAVCAAVWRVPVRVRVCPRPRCATGLSRVRLAAHGPGVELAVDRGRAVFAVHLGRKSVV